MGEGRLDLVRYIYQVRLRGSLGRMFESQRRGERGERGGVCGWSFVSTQSRRS